MNEYKKKENHPELTRPCRTREKVTELHETEVIGERERGSPKRIRDTDLKLCMERGM